MTDVSLVPAQRGAVVAAGLELPDPPPTRVYISGRLYRLSPSPQIPLPPIANVVRMILNWAGPAGRIAKNIGYVLTGGGFVTSDPVKLKALADAVQLAAGTANINIGVHAAWTLTSVTCKDAGGTTSQATSTAPTLPGLGSGTCLPPQSAVCFSWQIAESYRGGKPRWYMPGVPDTALSTSGNSQLTAAYATLIEAHGTSFLNAFSTLAVTGGGTFTLGTVSYHSGHTVRPVPLFRTFINLKIHERLDSQRRRNGPESAFPVIP